MINIRSFYQKPFKENKYYDDIFGVFLFNFKELDPDESNHLCSYQTGHQIKPRLILYIYLIKMNKSWGEKNKPPISEVCLTVIVINIQKELCFQVAVQVLNVRVHGPVWEELNKNAFLGRFSRKTTLHPEKDKTAELKFTKSKPQDVWNNILQTNETKKEMFGLKKKKKRAWVLNRNSIFLLLLAGKFCLNI